MARPSDTRQRIQAAARELFASQGVRKTSLQEIADRLGITKPALYYHFSSREDLVRSIVQPLIDEGEAFLRRQEAKGEVDARAMLGEYFDFHLRHREELMLILTELTTLAELGLVQVVLSWRERLAALLIGPEPTLVMAARATMALGGVQDCVVQFPHAPADELREATVGAALAVLGIPG
ncbi:TetR/AcrR family transcriptional regulator [Bailinhaonella thermotolerans]|uniref:TetR/AcrR family transcriptional regulator n=1 Tax=Bailinhaonella thermotolerans TaxID=1070861 RepID=A0A3A4AWU0_9ACTN|nr:TetR/AcrR family transcriptional regulator [Bailinhaonella thermotolerans]RJL32757.1 TetR/AcrR family transcriptional regulator [Bailinhaonella thermotolerans]